MEGLKRDIVERDQLIEELTLVLANLILIFSKSQNLYFLRFDKSVAVFDKSVF